MNSRERFHAIMNFKPFDRMPMVEWAMWWDKTVDRWHGEGLPASLTAPGDICKHFGLEQYRQDWIGAHGTAPRPAGHGQGIVASMADYDRVRPLLYPANAVNHERWNKLAALQASGSAVLWFSFDGAFWFPRQLLGIEQHLYAFYDLPELMHRIIADLGDFHLRVIDQLCTICTPDFMTFAEDLSYNLGPMLSKEQFDEFLAPYYRRLVPALKAKGILTIVDSDGDIEKPAQWFEEVGVEGMLPLERQSKVDVAALRKTHPTMRFIGTFDKMCMPQGEAAMRAEFERLLPTAKQGGLIISVDHQTPPGVSYQQYQIYMQLLQEYAEKAAK